MRTIIALGLLLVAACSTAYAQSSHRIIGTWELDPERTVFDDSASEPLRAIHKYEKGEDGFIVLTIARVGPNGEPGFRQVAFKLDGESYPLYGDRTLARFLTTGTPSTSMNSFKVVDANTLEQTNANSIRMLVVSADGQTLPMSVTAGSVNRMVFFNRVR